jgi:hypothetical protein
MLPDRFAICAVSHLAENVPRGVGLQFHLVAACLAGLESGAGGMV